jgi:translation initiation factor 1 (eIF-1/SUI1)
MNPFNEITNNNIIEKEQHIEIWVESIGKKRCTFISGLELSDDIMKEHLKNIKRNIGCNGTIKNNGPDKIKVLMLQGNQIDYINKYICDIIGIPKNNITLKG